MLRTRYSQSHVEPNKIPQWSLRVNFVRLFFTISAQCFIKKYNFNFSKQSCISPSTLLSAYKTFSSLPLSN